jgi:hypothetical protein
MSPAFIVQERTIQPFVSRKPPGQPRVFRGPAVLPREHMERRSRQEAAAQAPKVLQVDARMYFVEASRRRRRSRW